MEYCNWFKPQDLWFSPYLACWTRPLHGALHLWRVCRRPLGSPAQRLWGFRWSCMTWAWAWHPHCQLKSWCSGALCPAVLSESGTVCVPSLPSWALLVSPHQMGLSWFSPCKSKTGNDMKLWGCFYSLDMLWWCFASAFNSYVSRGPVTCISKWEMEWGSEGISSAPIWTFSLLFSVAVKI